MLVSSSFPTELAMPFSSFLPGREYIRAMREGHKTAQNIVTLMTFCRLVTVANDQLWCNYHVGVLTHSYCYCYAIFKHFDHVANTDILNYRIDRQPCYSNAVYY